jgi:hypothetical protein
MTKLRLLLATAIVPLATGWSEGERHVHRRSSSRLL